MRDITHKSINKKKKNKEKNGNMKKQLQRDKGIYLYHDIYLSNIIDNNIISPIS